jgi:hypothetical protein
MQPAYHHLQPTRIPAASVQPVVNKLNLPITLSEKEFYEYKEKLKKE